MLLHLNDDCTSHMVNKVNEDDLLPLALTCTLLRNHCIRRAKIVRDRQGGYGPLWKTAATKSMSRLGWALMQYAKPSSRWCLGAARHGQVAVLSWLERGGYFLSTNLQLARSNLSDPQGYAMKIARIAILRRHVSVLRFLDDRNCLQRCNNLSAYAAKTGCVESLQFLSGYSPCDAEGIMCEALNGGFVRMVDHVNRTLGVSYLTEYNGVTAQHIAAGGGHVKLLEWLQYPVGLCLEEKDNHGRSCLYHAVLTGAISSVEWLLKQGVDVDAVDINGKTALMIAGQYNDFVSMRALLDARADINVTDEKGWTALMFCVFEGRKDRVSELLIAGANVNRAASSGWTALLIACSSHDPAQCWFSSLRLLLNAGADVQAALEDGWTALMFCAETGNAAGVRELIESGASINARNRCGDLALHRAIGNSNSSPRHAECVALLRKAFNPNHGRA